MKERMNLPKLSAQSLPSKYRVLIVEDEFVVANDLRLMLEKADYTVVGVAVSVPEALELIEEHSPDILLLDIFLKGSQTGIDLAQQLAGQGIPFIFISANSNQSMLEEVKATQPYGFLVKPFREKDILVTLELARYRHAHSLEAKLRKEQTLQIALTDVLSANEAWEEKLFKMAELLQPYIPFDYIVFVLQKDGNNVLTCSFLRIGFEEYQTIQAAEFQRIMGITAEQLKAQQKDLVYTVPVIYNGDDFQAICRRHRIKQFIAKTFKMESNMVMPLMLARGGTFVLSFYSRQAHIYRAEHLAILGRLQQSLSLTLDRLLAFDEIERLSEQLHRENTYLLEEVKTNANFEEIIGTSQSLLQVFDQVTQVAPTDTSVLIMGESGTGKELFARSIHNLSPRKSKLLVKLNCATLPANLIESELFGHEKGAFTGAIDRRIGKFELANGGTIFLDEIGELPLELQAKLLRVLQEREIERLGGKAPIRVDVRIIAATNRNLEKEVAEGRFRLDLYYRLSVFPITLPPLRERKEDLALLANFFAQKCCKKIGKPFRGIKDTAMVELLRYNWPGNIRELENVVEQAVIINDGQSPLEWGRPLINPVAASLASPGDANALSQVATLPDMWQVQRDTERERILAVLAQTKGRIRGKDGAAELLNIKPTTLEARMEKLGIKKTHTLQS